MAKDAFGWHADLVVKDVVQRMRWIPSGRFTMGSDKDHWVQKPAHTVDISRGFWLADSEVTYGLWSVVMGSTIPHVKGEPTMPVVNVSWRSWQDFFGKLSENTKDSRAGFPTEAEWEHACRAGRAADYSGPIDAVGWHEGNAGGRPHPVRTKLPNAWGLFDMHGNLAEWVHDFNGSYSPGPQRDPQGPATGTEHIIRGGRFSFPAENMMSHSRYWGGPTLAGDAIGARIAIRPVE